MHRPYLSGRFIVQRGNSVVDPLSVLGGQLRREMDLEGH